MEDLLLDELNDNLLALSDNESDLLQMSDNDLDLIHLEAKHQKSSPIPRPKRAVPE